MITEVVFKKEIEKLNVDSTKQVSLFSSFVENIQKHSFGNEFFLKK